MKEFSSIFYENIILNDGTVLEGANFDAKKGSVIYKHKLKQLKKDAKLHIKEGNNKAAIKDLDEMEKLIKNFDKEMKIVIDDQSDTEVYIGILIYILRVIPATLISLPLGGLAGYMQIYKDMIKIQRSVDKDIEKAGGKDKYTSKTTDMNYYIQILRSSLSKYETYIRKTKKILQQKKATKECGLMDYDLI